MDQSEIEFRDTARKAVLPERLGRSLKDVAWNVMLNLIATVLFVLISILIYLSMQDTAQNFFEGLGLEVRAGERSNAGDQLRLPPPDAGHADAGALGQDKRNVATDPRSQ